MRWAGGEENHHCSLYINHNESLLNITIQRIPQSKCIIPGVVLLPVPPLRGSIPAAQGLNNLNLLLAQNLLTLHGRLGHFLPLPPPHRVAQPALLGTTSPETRQPTKAQEFSANWIAGRWVLYSNQLVSRPHAKLVLSRQGPELVVGSTGRTTLGTTSRLSKAAFLKDFLRQVSHNCYALLKVFFRQTAVPGARDVARSPLLRSHLPLRCSYAQLKYGAINYCEARQQLMRR